MKKIIAWLLVVVICAGMLPASALSDGEAVEESSGEISVEIGDEAGNENANPTAEATTEITGGDTSDSTDEIITETVREQLLAAEPETALSEGSTGENNSESCTTSDTEPGTDPADTENTETADAIGEAENTQSSTPLDDVFDLEEAYAYYLTLNDEETEEYLASLSEDNRFMLLDYIDAMNELALAEAEAAAELAQLEAEIEAEAAAELDATIAEAESVDEMEATIAEAEAAEELAPTEEEQQAEVTEEMNSEEELQTESSQKETSAFYDDVIQTDGNGNFVISGSGITEQESADGTTENADGTSEEANSTSTAENSVAPTIVKHPGSEYDHAVGDSVLLTAACSVECKANWFFNDGIAIEQISSVYPGVTATVGTTIYDSMYPGTKLTLNNLTSAISGIRIYAEFTTDYGILKTNEATITVTRGTEAGGVIASGTCGADGDNVLWSLDANGKLTLSGQGAMASYYYKEESAHYITTAPWGEYYDTITTVVIEDGVTKIGNSAFYGCSNLTSVIIPDSITAIDMYAFCGCTNLITIEIPDNVTSIETYTFSECTSLSSIVIPNSITSIGFGAFSGCCGLSSISIPDSVNCIESCAFSNCHSLTSIALPAGVTVIKSSTFYCCYNLRSVACPGVTSIGTSAFGECLNLSEIEIPENLLMIDAEAFYNCVSLTSMTVPKHTMNIGMSAFSNCSKLTTIIFSGSAPAFGENCFNGVTSSAYYPGTDTTWTADIRQNYGGVITWKAYVGDVSEIIPDNYLRIGTQHYSFSQVIYLSADVLGTGLFKVTTDQGIISYYDGCERNPYESTLYIKLEENEVVQLKLLSSSEFNVTVSSCDDNDLCEASIDEISDNASITLNFCIPELAGNYSYGVQIALNDSFSGKEFGWSSSIYNVSPIKGFSTTFTTGILFSNTTYYYRPYVLNSATWEYHYGSVDTFITPINTGIQYVNESTEYSYTRADDQLDYKLYEFYPQSAGRYEILLSGTSTSMTAITADNTYYSSSIDESNSQLLFSATAGERILLVISNWMTGNTVSFKIQNAVEGYTKIVCGESVSVAYAYNTPIHLYFTAAEDTYCYYVPQSVNITAYNEDGTAANTCYFGNACILSVTAGQKVLLDIYNYGSDTEIIIDTPANIAIPLSLGSNTLGSNMYMFTAAEDGNYCINSYNYYYVRNAADNSCNYQNGSLNKTLKAGENVLIWNYTDNIEMTVEKYADITEYKILDFGVEESSLTSTSATVYMKCQMPASSWYSNANVTLQSDMGYFGTFFISTKEMGIYYIRQTLHNIYPNCSFGVNASIYINNSGKKIEETKYYTAPAMGDDVVVMDISEMKAVETGGFKVYLTAAQNTDWYCIDTNYGSVQIYNIEGKQKKFFSCNNRIFVYLEASENVYLYVNSSQFSVSKCDDNAQPIGVGQTTASNRSLFGYTVPENGTYKIYIPQSNDISIYLFNANGDEILYSANDDTIILSDALKAKEYYIYVYGYSDFQTELTISEYEIVNQKSSVSLTVVPGFMGATFNVVFSSSFNSNSMSADVYIVSDDGEIQKNHNIGLNILKDTNNLYNFTVNELLPGKKYNYSLTYYDSQGTSGTCSDSICGSFETLNTDQIQPTVISYGNEAVADSSVETYSFTASISGVYRIDTNNSSATITTTAVHSVEGSKGYAIFAASKNEEIYFTVESDQTCIVKVTQATKNNTDNIQCETDTSVAPYNAFYFKPTVTGTYQFKAEAGNVIAEIWKADGTCLKKENTESYYNENKILTTELTANVVYYFAFKSGTATSINVECIDAEIVDVDKCGDNLTWTLMNDGRILISGSGEMYDYEYNGDTDKGWRNKYINSIEFSDKQTTIGAYAFSMTAVSSLNFPASVTEIEYSAFQSCNNLTSVSLPDTIQSLGNQVFADCVNLTEINLSQNISKISRGAFTFTKIRSIEIPESVKEIENNAFYGCYSLKNVKLPSLIETIGVKAFSYCSCIESITIPSSVTKIGNSCFLNCAALKEIYFEGDAPEIYTSEDNSYSYNYNYKCFTGVTATAYYPYGNETWTQEVRDAFGGNIIWIAVNGQMGDVNVDGSIDDSDVSLLRSYVAGLPVDKNNNSLTKYADVNEDGKISAVDVMLLQKYVKGLISEWPSDIPLDEAQNIKIYTENVTAEAGKTVELPVFISGNNINIYGFEISLEYDPALLEPVYEGNATAVKLESELPEGFDCMATAQNGVCKVVADGLDIPFSKEGELFKLYFQTKETAGDCQATISVKINGYEDTFLVSLDSTGSSLYIKVDNITSQNGTVNIIGERSLICRIDNVSEEIINVEGAEYSALSGTIVLPDHNPELVTAYTYSGSDTSDPHEIYPGSAKIYKVEKSNSGGYVLEEAGNCIDYNGASIRTEGNQGMRIVYGLSDTVRTALINGALDGLPDYKLIEYGTVATWADTSTNPYLGCTGAMSAYAYRASDSGTYVDTELDDELNISDSNFYYCNALTFTNFERTKPDLAIRPYMILNTPDGETITIYGGVVIRNIGYVAYQNKDDTSLSESEKEFINSIYNYVYPEGYAA